MIEQTKLEARVNELEALIRRLMSLLVRQSSPEHAQALYNLWEEYQDVLKQVNKDFPDE